MDISRAEAITNILKTTKQLGKNIKKPTLASRLPSVVGPLGTNTRLPPAVEGSGLIKIVLYVVAGILLIGLILLGVDQWITPIFQRTPGGRGYIPIPGTDLSQAYWNTNTDVANIIVGTPAPATTTPGAPTTPPPLSTTVIEGQSNYSITMDVFIQDESPQTVGADGMRTFFMLGQSVTNPTLTASIDNTKNMLYITSFDPTGLQESVPIENVPIRKPFRLGIVKTPFALEGYLDGKLVMTRQQRAANKIPTLGDILFSPANIIVGGNTLSKNIKVLKVRTFGYSVSPSEMQGRMHDLTANTTFNPLPV